MHVFISLATFALFLSSPLYARGDVKEVPMSGVEDCPENTTFCWRYNEPLLRILCGTKFTKADPLPDNGKTVCCKPEEKCVKGNGPQGIDLCTHPAGCDSYGERYECGTFRGGSKDLTASCRAQPAETAETSEELESETALE